jgi:ribbon-helix-helix protein
MAKTKKPNSKSRLKKAQLSFYPEPINYAALKALSARTRVKQQDYLREGLDYVLAKYAVRKA